MNKYIPEVLEDIQNDPSSIERYKSHQGFSILMKYAFDPTLKMRLPEGSPPFKPDAAPLGMTPTTLTTEARRLYVFGRPDISSVRLEQLFVQLLEGIHPSEAKILVAVKDQTITEMFPNVTRELLESNGIINPLPKQEPEVAVQPEPKSEVVSTSPVSEEGREIKIELVDSATSSESFGDDLQGEEIDASGDSPKKQKAGRPKQK